MNFSSLIKHRVIKFFAVTNFVVGLRFLFFPILFLYYIDKGMNPAQVGLLSAFWGASNILFEIPTGVIADGYGRKTSLVVGWFLSAIVTSFFPFANTFWELALVTFGMGLAMSFATGADQAWFVDSLKHDKLFKKLGDALALNNMVRNVGVLLGYIVTFFLISTYGMDSVWFVSAAITGLGAIGLAIFGEEKYFKRHTHGALQSMRESIEITKTALKYTIKNKQLQNFFIAVGFVTSLLPLFLSTTHLNNLGFPPGYFAVIYGAWAFMGIFGSYLSPWLVKKLNSEKWSLVVLELGYAFFAVIFALSTDLVTAVLAVVASFFFLEIRLPIRMSVFQKQVPSKIRATMGSVYMLVIPISIAVGNTTLGIIAESDLRFAMLISIITIIPGVYFFSKIKDC